MISNSLLTASATPTFWVVNQVTPYLFSVTTLDNLSSTGCISITLPSDVTFVSTSNCQASGTTNINPNPTCTSNTSSIVFCNISSSASIIPPQVINLTVNSIRNPLSTMPTGNFVFSTYYTSNFSTLVDTGNSNGITSKPGTISSTFVVITPSNNQVSATGVDYTIQFNNLNLIPANGLVVISIPSGIPVSTTTGLVCQAAIGNNTPSPTSCSGTSNSTFSTISFTTLFNTSIMPANSTITLTIKSVFTNPPTTQPVLSFSIQTYNGPYLID